MKRLTLLSLALILIAPHCLAQSETSCSVSPMLTTSWDIVSPYNKFCPQNITTPFGTVAQCNAGPVATAMAQVIRYWQRPTQPRGNQSYQYTYTPPLQESYSINYDTVTYNFANMPSTLYGVSDITKIDEVAKLLYHCALGCKTGWIFGGLDGAGAAYMSDAVTALVDFFDFLPSASLIDRAYYADTAWERIIKTELMRGRPVIYAGYNDTTGGWAFVCDGYNDNTYHFVFGLGGNGDGYYPLDSIWPLNSVNYSMGQQAIIGIEPANTIYDTIYQTVYVSIHDTVYHNDTIYLPVYIHDTINITEYIRDTIYLPQYIHDTVYIHDTIFVGVDEVDAINAKVYSSNGQIVVEGANGNTVTLYDLAGRYLATKQDYGTAICFDVPASGTYMIKIGNHAARKMVVIR